MPLIGFLDAATHDVFAPGLDDFRQGLRENGLTESGNVAIEYRWAKGQFDRLPAMATDFVRRHTTVIAAFGLPLRSRPRPPLRRYQSCSSLDLTRPGPCSK